jgi:hypothetical protein
MFLKSSIIRDISVMELSLDLWIKLFILFWNSGEFRASWNFTVDSSVHLELSGALQSSPSVIGGDELGNLAKTSHVILQWQSEKIGIKSDTLKIKYLVYNFFLMLINNLQCSGLVD